MKKKTLVIELKNITDDDRSTTGDSTASFISETKKNIPEKVIEEFIEEGYMFKRKPDQL